MILATTLGGWAMFGIGLACGFSLFGALLIAGVWLDDSVADLGASEDAVDVPQQKGRAA